MIVGYYITSVLKKVNTWKKQLSRNTWQLLWTANHIELNSI